MTSSIILCCHLNLFCIVNVASENASNNAIVNDNRVARIVVEMLSVERRTTR